MTTEQAEQSAQETAEPLTAQQAQVEIERLQGDSEFQKVYLSLSAEPAAHKESVSRMTKLFALAHPPEPPPRLAQQQGEQQQQEQQEQEQQKPLSEEEQAEAEINEAKQQMETRFGAEWQEEMPGVCESIQEVGGKALLEHLALEHGGDPEVLGQLIELQRENERYPLVAALAELAELNMTPKGARLELERRSADPEFLRRYTDSSQPGHKEALAVMRALHIAANPPSFITSGVSG